MNKIKKDISEGFSLLYDQTNRTISAEIDGKTYLLPFDSTEKILNTFSKKSIQEIDKNEMLSYIECGRVFSISDIEEIEKMIQESPQIEEFREMDMQNFKRAIPFLNYPLLL